MIEEFEVNRRAYKRCMKFYQFVGTTYILFALFFGGYFLGVYAMMGGILILFDFLIKEIIVAIGYYGIYKRKVFYLIVSLVVSLMIMILQISDGAIILPFIFTLLIIIPTGKVNSKYTYLENQVGFPYFNERVEEKRMDAVGRSIIDPYQAESDQRLMSESDSMDDIDLTGDVIEDHPDDRNNYMDEI